MSVIARFDERKCTQQVRPRLRRSKTSEFFGRLGLVVGCLSPALVQAQVTISPNWRDYAVVGLNSVAFTDNAAVAGDVYAGRDLSATYALNANGNLYSGGNLTSTFFTGNISGNVAANGSVAVNGASGNVIYGTTFSGMLREARPRRRISCPRLLCPRQPPFRQA